MPFNSRKALLVGYLLLVNVLLCLSQQNAGTASQAGKLFEDLVNYYNKEELPTLANNTEGHTVNITVSMKNIYDVSEQESSFKVNFNLELSWKDERFKFDTRDGLLDSTMGAHIDRVKEAGVCAFWSLVI